MITRLEPIGSDRPRLPLSVDEARQQCNLPHNDDDALLMGYIRSAAKEAEGTMNRILIARDFRLYADKWPGAAQHWRLAIPLAKLLSVARVEYDDQDGAPQELPAGDYEVAVNGAYPGWLQLAPGKSWPPLDPAKRLDRVRVDFRAGYGDHWDDIPADILGGLRNRIGTFYQIREDVIIGATVADVPGSAGAAYARHQVEDFGQ